MGAPTDGPGDPSKPFREDKWELYHVAEDFSECRDLATAYPDKLRELASLLFLLTGHRFAQIALVQG